MKMNTVLLTLQVLLVGATEALTFLGELKMNKVLFVVQILLVGAIMALLVLTVDYLINTPVVYTSYSTGKCVRIELEDKVVSCDRINELSRYDNVWVK